MNNNWQNAVTIFPIGVVVSALKEFDQIPNYQEEATIEIREDLAEGLQGLEHFSHLHIAYHQHRREEWKRRANIPEGTEQWSVPLMGEPTCKGVFTTRSPARPSAVGSCIVELLRREENRLYVRGLDAVDGTPVLDLKIYIPKYDCFPFADAPLHWCQKTQMLTTSRLLHWDTMNVGLALGMRVGQRVLRELGLTRGGPMHANVEGGHFFCQGVEAVTGCSMLRGTMTFIDKPKSLSDWRVVVEGNERRVEIQVLDQLHAGADDVLSLKDEQLFRFVHCNAEQRQS